MISIVGSSEATLMYREAAEAGAAVARFLAANNEAMQALGERLRNVPPSFVMTCARGSSDHAATYGKYAIETFCGIPVTSTPPSIASVFETPYADLRDALLIAVSQSGRSPDLLASVKAHKAAGATVIALVNDADSPLAGLADHCFPLYAGPELSVAATKSCIVSMVGFALLAATWSGEASLTAALATLPARLDEAFALDWSAAAPALVDATSLYIIGRGYGYGVAQEMALKLKETCSLHAESFSAAEVKHGPMALVHSGFPILALAASDATSSSVREMTRQMADRGARVFLADAGSTGTLPVLLVHPALEPITMLASFYRLANSLSQQRGLDPDSPPFLQKVTQTV